MLSKKLFLILLLPLLALSIMVAIVQTYSVLSSADTLSGSKNTSGGIRKASKAWVAVVIDDFGQHNNTGVKEIFDLDIPVTCAVMPNLENTRRHAEEAASRGHQVIVHLPMEPLNGKKSWLGPGAITTNLTDKEIKSLAKKDFEGVPHAVGFNNHMGSAVTVNDRIMRLILQVALEKNFFVLDSGTNGKSIIPSLSQEMGIAWTRRDVFLDNEKSLPYVKKQLNELSQKAIKNEKAVGIGHVGQGGKVTSRALEEMIPQMKEMGIKFVYLSDIVNTNFLEKIHTLP